MTVFRDRTFWHSDEALDISGAVVEASEFSLCRVGLTSPGWSRFSNIRLSDVRQYDCVANRCIFDDISVHNMMASGSFGLLLGLCGFRHVRLSGRIEGIKLGWTDLEPRNERDESSRRIVDFYRDVDWALDISRAHLSDQLFLVAVPGDKVVRDPATQAIVRRETLDRVDWPTTDEVGGGMESIISAFRELSPFDSMVVTAGAGKQDRESDLEEIARLRHDGILEPD